MEPVVKCPFCGSDNGCDHHVASIDFQFGEIQGGYLSWEDPDLAIRPIKDAFLAAHVGKLDPAKFGAYQDIADLWAGSEYQPDDEDVPVAVFAPQLYRIVAERLSRAGARSVCHEVDSGPGYTTECCDLFAEDPKQIVIQYVNRLHADLGL
jgi:hypothetical protein